MPGRNSELSWRGVDRLDHFRLERPQQRLAPAADATCASAVPQAPPPMIAELHAFTPAPRTGSALRRAASGPRRHIERIGQSRGEALDAGPGDHRGIVGAQPGGRDAEAAALRAGQLGQRAADRLVGRDAARNDQCRRIVCLKRAAGAVDEAVDHRLLEARGDVGAAGTRLTRPRAAPRS